jgi:hypothetical protein
MTAGCQIKRQQAYLYDCQPSAMKPLLFIVQFKDAKFNFSNANPIIETAFPVRL